MQAVRASHLEQLVNPTATPQQVADSRAVAIFIGEFFGGIERELKAQREHIDGRKELARAIARGEHTPGGSDYMEADSDEREEP